MERYTPSQIMAGYTVFIKNDLNEKGYAQRSLFKFKYSAGG